jgi:hypothetical protein
LAAWCKVPLLPIVTTVLAVIYALTAPRQESFPNLLVGLSSGFLSFGWLGTQFIWYRAAFDGQPITHSVVAGGIALIGAMTLGDISRPVYSRWVPVDNIGSEFASHSVLKESEVN